MASSVSLVRPFRPPVIALLVISGCFNFTGTANRAPSIERIVIANEAALRAGTQFESSVRCDARDPDGDNLSYEWTAGSGSTITGDPYSNPTRWKLAPPPASGEFSITCVASDGQFLAISIAKVYRR